MDSLIEWLNKLREESPLAFWSLVILAPLGLLLFALTWFGRSEAADEGEAKVIFFKRNAHAKAAGKSASGKAKIKAATVEPAAPPAAPGGEGAKA